MTKKPEDESPDSPSDLDEFKSAASSGPSVERTRNNRKFHFPFWAKLLTMAALVFLSSIGYLRSLHIHENAQNDGDIQEMSNSDVPGPDKRKNVPDIPLLSKGAPAQKLEQYKGKVVLLSFWASWCTPCLVELPTFVELYEKLGDKGLVILPVNVDEPETADQFVPDFWKTKKFPFPTFYDPEHKAADMFKIDTLPSNFVLDKKGKLVATGYGANEWSSDASVRFIEQLLSE